MVSSWQHHLPKGSLPLNAAAAYSLHLLDRHLLAFRQDNRPRGSRRLAKAGRPLAGFGECDQTRRRAIAASWPRLQIRRYPATRICAGRHLNPQRNSEQVVFLVTFRECITGHPNHKSEPDDADNFWERGRRRDRISCAYRGCLNRHV